MSGNARDASAKGGPFAENVECAGHDGPHRERGVPSIAVVAAALRCSDCGRESLRERVIRATHAAACDCGEEAPSWSTYWQQIADAAIAVLRGPSSDAERAVERVLALADAHADCCGYVAIDVLRLAVAGD